MALDPNIALQVRAPQFESPVNMMGQFAQLRAAENQNALAQYQLGAAQRTEARDVARMNALAQAGGDEIKAANALLSAGDVKGYSDLMKGIQDRAKDETELIGKRMELSRRGLETVRTPEEYIAWHEANHRDPILGKYLASRGVTADSARARIVEKLQQPGGFEQLLTSSALGLEKSMEQHFAEQNLGGSVRTIATPKYALPGAPSRATVVPGSQTAVTPLPEDVEAQKTRITAAGRPVTNVNVSTEKKYGEQFAGKMADVDIGKMTAAEKAPELAASANRVLDILGQGNVFTGSAADIKLNLARALNVVGANNDETIANTEMLVAGLARNTLGAVKSSGLGSGQGFTDKDLKFLQDAEGGRITLNASTLKQLAELSHKAAEGSANAWNKRVKELPASAREGTGLSAEPVQVPKRSTGVPIPLKAIADLKAGKGTDEQFDAIFGAGAAKRARGQ